MWSCFVGQREVPALSLGSALVFLSLHSFIFPCLVPKIVIKADTYYFSHSKACLAPLHNKRKLQENCTYQRYLKTMSWLSSLNALTSQTYNRLALLSITIEIFKSPITVLYHTRLTTITILFQFSIFFAGSYNDAFFQFSIW